jgi:hypothetical protein
MELINRAQDMQLWRAFVNTAVNLPVALDGSLTSWGSVGFSSRILPSFGLFAPSYSYVHRRSRLYNKHTTCKEQIVAVIAYSCNSVCTGRWVQTVWKDTLPPSSRQESNSFFSLRQCLLDRLYPSARLPKDRNSNLSGHSKPILCTGIIIIIIIIIKIVTHIFVHFS